MSVLRPAGYDRCLLSCLSRKGVRMIGSSVCHVIIHGYPLLISTRTESVDDLTFRKILPEVGPTPDLIEDDLPSNPEYIDDSYGTAGGFRALNEDEEDEEFDIPDATERGGGENVTVLAGGETIRLLTSEPIRVVEHHFDTIPPDTTQLDVP
jgi:hypothetical protein